MKNCNIEEGLTDKLAYIIEDRYKDILGKAYNRNSKFIKGTFEGHDATYKIKDYSTASLEAIDNIAEYLGVEYEIATGNIPGVKFKITDRTLDLYLSRENATILENGKILTHNQLKARQGMSVSELKKNFNKKAKSLYQTNLITNYKGKTYIVAGKAGSHNLPKAVDTLAEIRKEFGFTSEQVKIVRTNAIRGEKTISHSSAKSGQSYNYELVIETTTNPNEIAKNSQEIKAEAKLDTQRKGDYLLPQLIDAVEHAEEIGSEGFNYGVHIELKTKLVSELENFLHTIINRADKGSAQYKQISETKSIISKLKADLKSYKDPAFSLQNYFQAFQKDMEMLRVALERGSVEDLTVADKIIKLLENVNPEKDEGEAFIIGGASRLLKNSKIDEEDRAILKEQIHIFDRNLKDLKGEYNIQRDTEIINMVQTYYKQRHREEISLEEAEKIYKDKIDNALADLDLIDMALSASDEEMEGKNLTSAVASNIVARGKIKGSQNKLASDLTTIEDRVTKKLKDLKEFSKSSILGPLFSSVSFDRFYHISNKDGEITYELISIFSTKWKDFKEDLNTLQNNITDILYKPGKTKSDYDKISELRDELHEHTLSKSSFIDIASLSDIMDDIEIQGIEGVGNITVNNDYKEELISELGENEYNKLIEAQKELLYEYIAFRDNLIEHAVSTNPEIESLEDLPDKEFNSIQKQLFENNPIKSNLNYENGNKMAIPFRKPNGDIIEYYAPNTLKFNTITPNFNKNPELKNNKFKEKIEVDEDFKELWRLMDNAYSYINKNSNPVAGANHNKITSQVNKIRELATENNKFASLLSGHTLDWIKNVLTSAHKKEVKVKNKGGIATIESVINNNTKAKISLFKQFLANNNVGKDTSIQNPLVRDYLIDRLNIKKEFTTSSNSVNEAIYESESRKVVDSQETNSIQSLISQIELVNVHKAHKEANASVEFLLNKLGEQKNENGETKRENARELMQLFSDRKIYGINTRTASGKYLESNKTHEKAMMSEVSIGINNISKAIETLKSKLEVELDFDIAEDLSDSIKKLEFELKSLESFKDSRTRYITPGSIIEAVVLKRAAFLAFYGKFNTQLANIAVGNYSGVQMDGKLWKAGNIYLARKYSKLLKRPTRLLTEKEKKERYVQRLLFNRLRVIQNSANDMFDVKKGHKVPSTVGEVTGLPMRLPGAAEKHIQTRHLIAILGDETKVSITSADGKTTIPLFDLKAKNPLHAFTMTEDGKLALHPDFDNEKNRSTWLDNNNDEFADYFSESGVVPNIISEVNGNYKDMAVFMAEKNTLLAWGFMFKRWLGSTIKRTVDAHLDASKNKAAGTALAIATYTSIVSAYAVSSSVVGIASPIIVAGVIAGTVINKKRRQRELDESRDISKLKFLGSLIYQTLTSKGLYVGALGTVSGGTVKSAEILINNLLNKEVIKREWVNKAAFYNHLPGTQEEVEEAKKNLQVLLATFAYTLMYSSMRLLVHALLPPDEDETRVDEFGEKMLSEKKRYNKDVDSGKGFWSRLMDDPSISSYYLLENQSQKIMGDINVLSSLENFLPAILPTGEDRSVKGFFDFVDSFDKQSADGDISKGKNEGKSWITVAGKKFIVPSSFDGLSGGFNSASERDWSIKDNLDRIYTGVTKESDKKSQTKQWKKLRAEHANALRKKLLKDPFLKYNKKERDEKILKSKNMLYPSISKFYNEDGSIKPWAMEKVKPYMEEGRWEELTKK